METAGQGLSHLQSFQKLKMVKQALKELNKKGIGDIEVVVVKTRAAL